MGVRVAVRRQRCSASRLARTCRAILGALIASALLAAAPTFSAQARESSAQGRIFVLMVWDGLRPDLVTQQNTPNLFAMAREGVRFDRHHSLYPTLTMVNAAALGTGSPPGISGLLGNVLYLRPALRSKPLSGSDLAESIGRPARLENTKLLTELSGPDGFQGHLLGLDTVAQEAEREGGYIGVAGKDGPTFLFDNRVASLSDGRDSLHVPHKDYLFATDDMVAPESEAKRIADGLKSIPEDGRIPSPRDAFFTRVVIDKVLPAAKAASEKGRPALIVLWLREPDWTQHRAGLGTVQNLQALTASDTDLGRLRDAIAQSGIGERTDVMVVSDHGFATMRMRLDLNGLLVAAGIKKSIDSTEIVIGQNGGSDFIYLSPSDFDSPDARREILQKIVKFAEAQEWCGPIFSRQSAADGDRQRRHGKDYLGWIEGTFSEAAVGIYNQARSPDLVISFREYPDLDNSTLTGPGHPAFQLDGRGQHSVANRSKELARPVKGLIYADVLSKLEWTTGMGMHGAAGTRELHNFCAATGPDFRERFVDRSPTGNADVAPTITRILHLKPNVGPGGAYATGRAMEEALSGGGGAQGASRAVRMTADLDLPGMRVITTLSATQLKGRLYLDDSSVEHVPFGRSP